MMETSEKGFEACPCKPNATLSAKWSYKAISSPIYLGEGPHWDAKSQSLYFVDIFGQTANRLDYKTNAITSAYFSHGAVGAVVPVEGTDNKLIVACDKDIFLVTWDGKQNVTDPPSELLTTLEPAESDTRVNDGKCDKNGRLWIGTMANEKPGGVIKEHQGGLYKVEGKEKTDVLRQISISNGLAWNSRNDIMYYIDSTTKRVFSYDFDLKNGQLSNKQVIFDLVEKNLTGIPDGMTIDRDDKLWIVIHDGHSIVRVNPVNSEVLLTIPLPARRITSVTFGGPEYDILYVTSAYHGVDDKERKEKPESGCIFAITGLGVKGLPANNFVLQK